MSASAYGPSGSRLCSASVALSWATLASFSDSTRLRFDLT